MRTLYWRLSAVAMAAGTLSACGSSENISPPPSPPPVAVPQAKFEDQFGTNFGIAYRNDPNTDAKDPVAGDIVPLSLTTDPVPA